MSVTASLAVTDSILVAVLIAVVVLILSLRRSHDWVSGLALLASVRRVLHAVDRCMSVRTAPRVDNSTMCRIEAERIRSPTVTEERTLDAAALAEAMVRFHELLETHREQLNRLNVYPVPDADTGNNLRATLQSVVDELQPASSMAEVSAAVRRGALLGARGASGVIMAQLLGALAATLADTPAATGAELANALEVSSNAAYQAVVRPVEGTILTVARDAAAAARQAEPTAGAGTVAVIARTAAEESLQRTPDLLPLLKAAGVVDSGGMGYLLFLDALAHVTTGTSLPKAGTPRPAPSSIEAPPTPRFEVVLRLEVADGVLDEFRDTWDGLGNESTVVIEDGGWWLAHIHTDDLDSALETARAAGQIRDLQITDLQAQIAE